MRYCTKCGMELLAQTKFCTKCGAALRVPSSSTTSGVESPSQPATASSAQQGQQQTIAPVATSAAAKPNVAIAAIGVVLALVVVAGLGYAIHLERQKVAEKQALDELQKSLATFSASEKNTAQQANKQAPDLNDANKSLADLAAAANALTNSVQRQGGANPLNATPAAVGAASSSTSTSSASNANSAPNSADAIAVASAAANAALNPPLLPTPVPIQPEAATGNQPQDWALKYERTVGSSEADLVVRTGDINNLGYGWPVGFDPFSGKSTPPHQWPEINKIPSGAPDGTDRIMLGTGVMPVHMSIQHVPGQADRIAVALLVKRGLPSDGYSGSLGDCFLVRDFETQLEDPHAPVIIASKEEGYNELTRYWAPKCTRARALTMPVPIALSVGELPGQINAVLFQIFADDFQPMPMHSHFQVSLNGTQIPTFEYAINALDQSGPIGKLLTLKLLPEYWPLLKSGTVNLLIDDPTTHVPDGYAIDFVRILVNPHKLRYEVSLSAHVVDADKNTPIANATVTAALESAATDRQGRCELKGIPAGLVVATASAPGYDENSVPVDLPAGQTGNADIQLHQHQESTAALEQSIAQTGTATIYGIHFDTNSSKIRDDSIPALNAVLGLIKNHSDSRWIIAGHTDNQGNTALNQPLSEARAKSVVTWLKNHGAVVSGLVPQGFGATRPVADNATANGRALNRRVEVALVK